jgi:hypothetical protein
LQGQIGGESEIGSVMLNGFGVNIGLIDGG